MEEGNATATKLLTLINVSATTTRASKRRSLLDEIAAPPRKLNKRKSVQVVEVVSDEAVEPATEVIKAGENPVETMEDIQLGGDDEKDEDCECCRSCPFLQQRLNLSQSTQVHIRSISELKVPICPKRRENRWIKDCGT